MQLQYMYIYCISSGAESSLIMGEFGELFVELLVEFCELSGEFDGLLVGAR